MNLIKKIKRIYNSKLLKGSIDLILVMVSVLVVSYAWFVNTSENQMNDLYVKTKASRLLYISLDNGKTWSTELNLNLNDKFKFNNEVTGNGINFFKALYKREDGTPITFVEATKSLDYLEFDILFKSSVPLGVFLDSDSSILPAAGTKVENLVGATSIRKSSYGDFSRDLIAGGIRIAFIENDFVEGNYVSKLKPSLVWAPNKNYELKYNNSKYTFDINSNNKQEYKYINPVNGVKYELVDNLKDNLNADFVNENSNGDPMITKIDEKYNDGIRSVTVRVWVEGNDRETHSALSGGLFKLNLNFLGLLKEENKIIPDVYVEKLNNKILNFNETMEYSNDNGNTWIKYSENNNPQFSTGDIVFVRYYENDNYYPSNYKILEY